MCCQQAMQKKQVKESTYHVVCGSLEFGMTGKQLFQGLMNLLF
jgi:hypothetical protein